MVAEVLVPPDRNRQGYRSVTLNLTDEQHERVRLLADRKFSSVSQVAREIVQEALERDEKRDEHAHAR